MTQISKEELYTLFYSSKTAGISKIKKWFVNEQLKILENVLGNTIQEKVFNLLFRFSFRLNNDVWFLRQTPWRL